MTPSRLEVPQHALDRLKLRRVTRKQIRECLYKGKLVSTDGNGRRISEKRFGKQILIVVYLLVQGGYLVITTYWKDTK
jgi:hypothetical protein